jgi:hypothetical protein
LKLDPEGAARQRACPPPLGAAARRTNNVLRVLDSRSVAARVMRRASHLIQVGNRCLGILCTPIKHGAESQQSVARQCDGAARDWLSCIILTYFT